MLNSRPYHRNLLQSSNFEINEFIYLTRDIPFQKISHHLNEHLDEVKKELGQLVNAEFEKFISLYSGIGDIGSEEIEALQCNIGHLKELSNHVQDSIGANYEEITRLLEELKLAVAEEGNLQKQNEFRGDVDSFIHLLNGNHLELASVFSVKLSAQVAAAPCLNHLEDVVAKFEDAQDLLKKQLDSHTRQLFQEEKIEDLDTLARSFLCLDQFHDFERIFVESVIFPFCNQTFTTGNLESLLKSENETPALQQILEKTLDFIKHTNTFWITTLKEIIPPAKTLTVNLLISPILSSIQSGLPIIFSPTIPDSFQHSYTLSFEFLRQLLLLFPEDRNLICSHCSWKTFIKGWQVNIYYQLRFRDTVSDIEDSLDVPLPIVDFNLKRINLCTISLKQFEILQKSVLSLWSDTVLITPLIPKFFKLSIQSFARYIDWLASFPQEFEGTELGLSAILLKMHSLFMMNSLLLNFKEETLFPILTQANIDTQSFHKSIDNFMSSKWLAGKEHLKSLLLRSFRLVCAVRSKSLLENYGINSKIQSAAKLIEAMNPTLNGFLEKDGSFQDVLSGIADDLAVLATPVLEGASKAAANAKRIQSLLRDKMSEEDCQKLACEKNLKMALRDEIELLIGESKALGTADICKEVPSLDELYKQVKSV